MPMAFWGGVHTAAAASSVARHRVSGEIIDKPDAQFSVGECEQNIDNQAEPEVEHEDQNTAESQLDPPMRARVVAAGFGDYAAGLRRTQPRLHFTGPVPPLDARYQTATLGAQLVRSLFGVTTQTRYTVQGCVSYEMVFRFWVERIRTRLATWRELPVEARPAAPAYTREERDQAARTCVSWRLTREDLEVEYRGFSANDFLSVGDFPSYFASWMQARLPEILEYTQERKTHKTAAHYRLEAAAEAGAAAASAGPAGVVLGDVPFPPDMEVVLDAGLGLGSCIVIPADLRCRPRGTRRFASDSSLADPTSVGSTLMYMSELQRHQSRHSSAVSRLQAEVERLRTRLEVEGIPFDSSEEDEDGSSSDDAPLSPPPQAAAGPSHRISRQYGMIQRVPRVHNFESGLITPHLLTNLADCWRNRNTMYLDEGMMQDTVTPAYANWFFTP
ncbi:hypothetical protein JCGZ_03574 [Jatropha curcas]|uniref:Aminotransferase-like plant mobile domain-containing protein n=1 Tax=Jatropha curcas TaxID=180498 RepID=A0A067KY02_JATCU|nr:hypothetical protein JCGZ_03574 [Jatropha curcas]